MDVLATTIYLIRGVGSGRMVGCEEVLDWVLVLVGERGGLLCVVAGRFLGAMMMVFLGKAYYTRTTTTT